MFSSDRMTKGKFKNNLECHYEITKQELDSGNFTRISEFMQRLESYGSLPRQKVMFTFAGYDDDKRELIQIPEVVKHTQIFINKHPSFWYYAIPARSPFFFMAMTVNLDNYLLVANDATRVFMTKLDNKRTRTLVEKMAVDLEAHGELVNDKPGAMDCLMAWAKLISFG